MLNKPERALGRVEFVILMAWMSSFVALSIDIMLPALGIIGSDLGIARENDRQLVLTVLFVGMAFGQLLYGPISDSTGRKPVLLFGTSLFIVGCLISALAESFAIMLVGRFLQGLGAAAARNIPIAMIRDCHVGREMAQIMSLIMAVFILVPMIAPMLGQGILWVWDWRGIFYVILAFALICQLWFSLRQPETLLPERRTPFTARQLWWALRAVCTNRQAMAYTVAMSLIFAAFLGYLTSAQQIFQDIYLTGDHFPLYFAAIAASLCLASLTNSKLVMRLGMRLLVNLSLLGICSVACLFMLVTLTFDGHPPFWSVMVFFLIGFFPLGVLFGNLNALAMEPLGQVAGMGAAVIGSLSTLLSLLLGTPIGMSFNGTVTPLITGFLVYGSLAALICILVKPAELHDDEVAESGPGAD